MKKIGTLNTHLSRIIASMGHTDRLVICDSGLPIPRGKEVVDLALTTNIPRFIDTLRVVLQELEVESAIVADEMAGRSNGVHTQLQELLAGVPVRTVSHEDFKRLTTEAATVAIVRTGEATPYANVILVSRSADVLATAADFKKARRGNSSDESAAAIGTPSFTAGQTKFELRQHTLRTRPIASQDKRTWRQACVAIFGAFSAAR